MKYLACFLLSLSFATTVFSGDDVEKLQKECLKPTVMLHTPDDSGFSSAFVVRSELVGHKYRNVAISCYHCIEGCSTFHIHIQKYDKNGKLMGYTIAKAVEYASHEGSDLTILLFESDEKCNVVKLAPFNYELKFGESVRKIGFGLGDDANLEEGKITGVFTRRPACFAGLIRTNLNITQGDSGGPLFNAKNEVVGVNHAFRICGVSFFNRSYYIPMSKFKTWDDGSNNAFAFVYNLKEKMPVMAFTIMRLSQYEPVGEKNAIFRTTRPIKTGY